MDCPPPNPTRELAGQTALVTGASSGLGRRFAQVLAACGARVAVASRRRDRLEELAGEIRAAGGSAVPIELDILDPQAIAAAVASAETALGPVRILVNNAAVAVTERATDLPLEDVDQVLQANVRGPYLLACEVARRLIAAKLGGRIINIASSAAFEYRGQGGALYSISKAAVVRMTETLAVEWAGYGINVNCVAPGVFATEMTARSRERLAAYIASTPRRRIGDPTQLDATLAYLASPSSEFITGAVIRADDGQGAR